MTAFDEAWTLLKNAPNPNYLHHRDMNIRPYNPTSHREIIPNPYAPEEKVHQKPMIDAYKEHMERMKEKAPYGQGNPNDNNLPYNPYQPQPNIPFTDEAKRNPFEHERPPYQQNNPQYRN